MDPSGKKSTGWGYCGLIGFCLAVNILTITYQTLTGPVKKLWAKFRGKRGVNSRRKARKQTYKKPISDDLESN